MIRLQSETKPPETVEKLAKDSMASLTFQIEQLPWKEKIFSACKEIIRVWSPIRKIDNYSRKASVDAAWGSTEMHLTLAPSDSIRSTFEIFEYLENTLNIEFSTTDSDESRRFHCCKNNVGFSVYIYFKYSQSCSIVETRREVTFTDVKRKIICL